MQPYENSYNGRGAPAPRVRVGGQLYNLFADRQNLTLQQTSAPGESPYVYPYNTVAGISISSNEYYEPCIDAQISFDGAQTSSMTIIFDSEDERNSVFSTIQNFMNASLHMPPNQPPAQPKANPRMQQTPYGATESFLGPEYSDSEFIGERADGRGGERGFGYSQSQPGSQNSYETKNPYDSASSYEQHDPYSSYSQDSYGRDSGYNPQNPYDSHNPHGSYDSYESQRSYDSYGRHESYDSYESPKSYDSYGPHDSYDSYDSYDSHDSYASDPYSTQRKQTFDEYRYSQSDLSLPEKIIGFVRYPAETFESSAADDLKSGILYAGLMLVLFSVVNVLISAVIASSAAPKSTIYANLLTSTPELVRLILEYMIFGAVLIVVYGLLVYLIAMATGQGVDISESLLTTFYSATALGTLGLIPLVGIFIAPLYMVFLQIKGLCGAYDADVKFAALSAVIPAVLMFALFYYFVASGEVAFI